MPKMVRESPAERRGRLKAERRCEYADTSTHQWLGALMDNLSERSSGLVNASFRFDFTDRDMSSDWRDDETALKNTLWLQSGVNEIAHMKFMVRKRDGRIEAVIEEFQGHRPKEEMDVFREDNGDYWNIRMVNDFVGACWDARFSRVLLQDIKGTKDYENPHSMLGGELIHDAKKKAQQRMDHLYMVTAKQCGFTDYEKHPSHPDVGYYVRNFP